MVYSNNRTTIFDMFDVEIFEMVVVIVVVVVILADF